jgi:serine/threonine protein kinase
MSYCLNPGCGQPQNGHEQLFCQSCSSKLVLRQHFRALRKIGEGGFGRTFLGVDEDLPSKPYCAIKQFFPRSRHPQAVEKAIELFTQEAIRLDDLGKHHPQIPRLLAYFEQDGCQYLVQEYIDGQNLEQELETRGAFNETQTRQLLLDLLPVLEFIHSNQVIHRDIKPENIIRRTPPRSRLTGARESQYYSGEMGGHLVLVDFGAAKFATGTALATTQTKIGDFRYIAPEQAAGRSTFASDLYSLGVTCIHLLTGIPAGDLFDDWEADWVWQKYLSTPLSPTLIGILNKMLASATKARFRDATAIIEALQNADTSGTQINTATHIALTQAPVLSLGRDTSGRQRDYTLIIDKSQSMHQLNPITGITRWEEAQNTALSLMQHYEQGHERGMTVYFFGSLFKRYDQVKSSQLSQLFQQTSPTGSTDLVWVLKAAIRRYFQQKAQRLSQNRHTIMIITDGEPDDSLGVRRILKSTYGWTQQTQEITVVFIQVGADQQASCNLQSLGHFQFCQTVTARDLVQGVNGQGVSALNEYF